ncbi:MAG TPA: DNA polymerase III subunit gamma/tau [Enhygromyxa sp.]|nr:DNA polymerase III subunit gamma/tau [Enhygromyxa sp.]
MAYLALARKYRPQRFADMIGQEHVTRTLENAIRTDRVHHAYLFCGVRGLGKTTAARILAKCLVCERGPTPEPCNQCTQCVAINEGRSVDVIEIDGASNNSVEDIRSLRDQVNYLPHSARRKIYIIDEVHMLTMQAFNALLKTLEEPPPHVTFMFATTDPHKVLPTILSRVSRLDYRRVRAATLVPYLREILTNEGFAVEDEGLHVIARCGEGSVRDSLTLLDKVIAFASDPKAITSQEVLTVLGQASRYAVAELVQAILDRDVAAVLTRFEDITSTGGDLLQLAVAILQHLRDLAVVKLTDSSRAALLDMDDDLFEQLGRQAATVDAELLAQHFDRFARTIGNLENSRVPRLVIEMGLIELANAEPLLPLGDLVARLDALAGGRSSPGGRSGPAGGGVRGGPRGGGGRELRAAPAKPSSNAAPVRPPERVDELVASPTRHEARDGGNGATGSSNGANGSSNGANGSSTSDDPIDMLEQLARDAGLLPGGPSKRAQPAPARMTPTPARSEPARPPDPEPPPTVTASPPEPATDFALTNEELAPAVTPGDPEAGCPSSRCVPREAIPWRTLSPWDAWESFLDRIRKEHDVLPHVLGDVGFVGLRPGVVQLAVSANSFTRSKLLEPELKTTFEQLTAAYFGEVMRLELIDAAPSLPEMPSLALVDQQRQAQHRAAMIEDARHNPRICSLLRTFGAQLETIEPLGSPALPPVGQRGLPL